MVGSMQLNPWESTAYPCLPTDRCFLLAEPEIENEPLVVRYRKYKPCMVHLRSRLAAFIRQRRGSMPQRAFARKIGVAQSTIMRIENEDQNVTLLTLEQLCKAFQVDVGELFPAVDTIRHYPSARDWRSAEGAAAMVHEKPVLKGRRKRVEGEVPDSNQ